MYQAAAGSFAGWGGGAGFWVVGKIGDGWDGWDGWSGWSGWSRLHP